MPDPIALHVNGHDHLVAVEPETPLLYVLRNDLRLKGTRFGCGLGQCGACNVIVDGRVLQSCDTPVWAVAGKRITTIEGVGTVDRMHVLQQAFVDEQAAQCGYCINGMIVSALALLSTNQTPSDEDIRAALDRNLCRCGTHNRIVDAIQRAAGLMRAAQAL